MLLIINILAGGLVGILINYLSDVFPVSRGFTRPGCAKCSHPYTLREYVTFTHCPQCGAKRSKRSFIVLMAAVIICLLLNYFPFSTLSFWASLPLLLFLGVIVVIDVEHRVVLIETSIVGFGLCLVYGIVLHGIPRTLVGGLVGFLIMILFYLLGLAYVKIAGRLRHSQIDEVAFGFGDVMAGAFLGLLLGWPSVFQAILIAIFSFGAYSLIYITILLISKRYQAFSAALAFTPFLILGTIATFYL